MPDGCNDEQRLSAVVHLMTIGKTPGVIKHLFPISNCLRASQYVLVHQVQDKCIEAERAGAS